MRTLGQLCPRGVLHGHGRLLHFAVVGEARCRKRDVCSGKRLLRDRIGLAYRAGVIVPRGRHGHGIGPGSLAVFVRPGQRVARALGQFCSGGVLHGDGRLLYRAVVSEARRRKRDIRRGKRLLRDRVGLARRTGIVAARCRHGHGIGAGRLAVLVRPGQRVARAFGQLCACGVLYGNCGLLHRAVIGEARRRKRDIRRIQDLLFDRIVLFRRIGIIPLSYHGHGIAAGCLAVRVRIRHGVVRAFGQRLAENVLHGNGRFLHRAVVGEARSRKGDILTLQELLYDIIAFARRAGIKRSRTGHGNGVVAGIPAVRVRPGQGVIRSLCQDLTRGILHGDCRFLHITVIGEARIGKRHAVDLRNALGSRLAANAAGEGLNAVFGERRLLRYSPVVPFVSGTYERRGDPAGHGLIVLCPLLVVRIDQFIPIVECETGLAGLRIDPDLNIFGKIGVLLRNDQIISLIRGFLGQHIIRSAADIADAVIVVVVTVRINILQTVGRQLSEIQRRDQLTGVIEQELIALIAIVTSAVL